jgi:hypothetical protein
MCKKAIVACIGLVRLVTLRRDCQFTEEDIIISQAIQSLKVLTEF